jgi:hypothetical protein
LKFDEAIDAILKKANAGRSRLHLRRRPLGSSLKKAVAFRKAQRSFNFAVSPGWTAENPAAEIEKPSLSDSNVCVLTPEQVWVQTRVSMASS